MTNDLKLVCLYSLLSGAGERIIKYSKNKKEKKIAGGLMKLGRKLLDKSGIKVDKNMVFGVYSNIARVYPDHSAPPAIEVISFVFLGIFEVYMQMGLGKALDVLIPVFIRALKVYDPKLENDNIYSVSMEKYFSWESGD